MAAKRSRPISVQAGYDLWAETYDLADNPVVALDARHSLRILDPQPGELILDAGCGTGRNLASIAGAGATAIGIDFSLQMLQRARQSSAVSRVAAVDLQRGFPFRSNSFDAALCALVGEHLTDLAGVLSDCHRVLKPGARLIFSVFHPDQAAAGIEANFECNGIEYRLGAELHSVQDYLDAVVDAGFDEVAFAGFRGGAGSGRYEGQPLVFLIAATAAPSP